MRLLELNIKNKRQDAATPRRQAEHSLVTWALSPCANHSHRLKTRVTMIFSTLLFLVSWRLGVVAFVRSLESAG